MIVRLYPLRLTSPFFRFLSVTLLFLLYLFGCASSPDTEIQVENPYRDRQWIYAPSSLTDNLVAIPNAGIALPSGWLASLLPTENDYSIALILHNEEQTAIGRYEVVDLDGAGVSWRQARLLFERFFDEPWRIDGRYTIGTERGPILMINATDEERTRIGFFRYDDERVYVASFLLDTGDDTKNESLVQQLYDYTIAGESVDNHFATARLRGNSVSFFGIHTGFRWIADTQMGIVLAGRIDDTDLLFEINQATPDRGEPEGTPLVEPVIRHRLITNQAAILRVTHVRSEGHRVRYFGTIEVAPTGVGERFDIVLTVPPADDTATLDGDSRHRVAALVDSETFSGLIRDELVFSGRSTQQ